LALLVITATRMNRSSAAGLDPSTGDRGGDRIESVLANGGVELLRARFAGRAYAKHRHDTYAICVTDRGLQAFDYRGATRISASGQVVVLHPDEAHDGRAGSEEGFGYRIVYVAPGKIAAAARSLRDALYLRDAGVPLPFVGEPVLASATLAKAVTDAFQAFPAALEPLALDAVIEALARGLIEADPSIRRNRRRVACDLCGLERARQFLDTEKTRIVTSGELEAISGHDRFTLARQFRQIYGTSPYRYLLMRRLDWVRGEIRAGKALAGIAVDAGFADQSHLTRVFKAAYGLSPAQFRAVS
jgi:AraC-like DNA-binding protein